MFIYIINRVGEYLSKSNDEIGSRGMEIYYRNTLRKYFKLKTYDENIPISFGGRYNALLILLAFV
jgi:hypothetical protein